jgi:hypothetical protein
MIPSAVPVLRNAPPSPTRDQAGPRPVPHHVDESRRSPAADRRPCDGAAGRRLVGRRPRDDRAMRLLRRAEGCRDHVRQPPHGARSPHSRGAAPLSVVRRRMAPT